ncbi:MAG: putative phasyl DNA replicon protein arp [Microviridae sp.]|nr:MAG: putative phasyl DNA replicon protein arp [Microviridae sp.]
MNIIDSVCLNSSDTSRDSNPFNSCGHLAIEPAAIAGDSLPCLSFRNNSLEIPQTFPQIVSTNWRKGAFLLGESVRQLSSKFGLHRLGFLTLTFSEDVQCPVEARKRLGSLSRNVIAERYPGSICVFERQKSGRIHFHLIVVCPVDIRTGFDFDAIAERDYRSANKALRAEWAFWRRTAKKYGFGRTELLPIRSNTEAIARYVGKYLGKGFGLRESRDKGVRRVSYSGAARVGTCNLQLLNSGTRLWRSKVAIFAAMVQATYPGTRIDSMAELNRVLGPKWAYRHREFIQSL